jgi:L-ascorbate metabolism protein UlaG (beta-lactamase superfamily)
MMIAILSILLFVFLFILTGYFYMKLPMFGRTPSGQRLERIQQSPHYRDGSFQNLNNTPALTEGVTYSSVMKEFFLRDKSKSKPGKQIPSQKTDLKSLKPDENVLVWFGHSSYFLQVDGKRILVDPVLSGAASPVAFTTRAFAGSDVYTPEDFPEIDFLFISHDHWDHLDYKTIMKLKPKIGKIICGLGTGEHFERWGFDMTKVLEADWKEHLVLGDGFEVFTVPSRHFSGRGFKRNKALWLSFVLQTPSLKLFLGGDSGYDTHFLETGKKHGPFDLAILENGQYDKSWKYIHMKPAETLMAAKDLGAKRLFPVHSSKFSLANHNWDEPLKTISALAPESGIKIITPLIGEAVHLKNTEQRFSPWWTTIS